MVPNEVLPGLVKRLRYNPNPIKEGFPYENPSLQFTENAPCLFRVDRFSAPTEAAYAVGELILAKRCYASVLQILKENPGRRLVDFTVIDGTTWYDAVEHNQAVCPIAANVMWDGKVALMTVLLGYQNTVKTSKLFHMRTGYTWPIYFRFQLGEDDEEVHRRITYYINNRNQIPLTYADSFLMATALSRCFNPMAEYPVAAATKLDDFVWYVDRPYRHHHVIHSPEYLQARKEVLARPEAKLERFEVQGFLTNHGNFVSRKRAMYMAVKHRTTIDSEGAQVKNGFTTKDPYTGIIQEEDMSDYGVRICMTDLFSEDLW